MGGLLVGTAAGLFDLGSGVEGPAEFAGHDVTALAVGGWDSWAILDRRAIWRRDATAGWREVASAANDDLACLLPAVGRLLVGTAGARVLRLTGGVLQPVAAFERVPGREGWYTPWGGPPETRSLAADGEGALYANVHVGGVPRSDDGGETWRPTIDIRADVHQVLCHPERAGVVLAASARGLAISRDAGRSWAYLVEGLHGRYLRAVGVADDTVLITASTGDSSRQAAVYRRPLDGDGPFERCRRGLPEWFGENIDTHCLAARGSVAAFGTGGGEVYVSADAGGSWERVAAGLPPARCVVLG